jgi:hypothetical protein
VALRSSRFSHAVTACVFGVMACGLSLALAGASPHPPADPLDALPPNVHMGPNTPCASEAMDLANGSTTLEEPGPSTRPPCWRMSLVRSATETGNQLADRLAEYYGGRGFTFTGQKEGDARSYYGTLPVCGTILGIDSGATAMMTAPGVRSSYSTDIDPATAQGLAGMVQGEPGAMPGLPATPDPSTPDGSGETVTSTTVAGAVDPTVTDPGVSLPGPTTDPAASGFNGVATIDPFGTGGPTSGDQPGDWVVLSVQQPKAVAPKGAEGRC